jgi:hypothetical protein
MWAGYTGERNLTVDRSPETQAAFKVAAAQELRSSNVDVEVCDRARSSAPGKKSRLIQMAVFLEGRQASRKAFQEGRLNRISDRPVHEAAICYEPASGAIEVVAATQQTRETLLRLFSEHMLSGSIPGERLPLREYTLQPLLRPFDFPRQTGDQIESVEVMLMRLMPMDAQSERVTLERMRGASRSIRALAADRFGDTDPLRGGYRVTQVRLRIQFAPRIAGRGRRTLPVTISMPHGCDLKGRTAQERLIGDKYLSLWGLRRDVA